MQKIVYAVLATLSGLVLIFSYRTSLDVVQPTAITDSAVANSAAAPSPTDSGSASGSTAVPDRATSDTASGASATAAALTDGTYSGSAVSTRYGPVQVQIGVSAGLIADVQVTDHPSNSSTDRQINAYAIPILVAESTQAQSARIDMVSGASYTSQGYISSLQSAIDQARG